MMGPKLLTFTGSQASGKRGIGWGLGKKKAQSVRSNQELRQCRLSWPHVSYWRPPSWGPPPRRDSGRRWVGLGCHPLRRDHATFAP